METPENEMRAMREAEIRAKKHRNVSNDPEFNEMMDDMLSLVEKYGLLRVVGAIKEDYRNKNWINIL